MRFVPRKEDAWVWGPAEVSYPDWQGTAQLDQKVTGEVNLYTFADIDHQKWFVVGLDFGGGESGFHDPAIVVIDQNLLTAGGGIDGLIAEYGYLPCVHILLHDVDTAELLQVMMHVFDMRLRIRSVLDAEIRIIDQRDIPEQDQ
mgnify:CR=1 FL=1